MFSTSWFQLLAWARTYIIADEKWCVDRGSRSIPSLWDIQLKPVDSKKRVLNMLETQLYLGACRQGKRNRAAYRTQRDVGAKRAAPRPRGWSELVQESSSWLQQIVNRTAVAAGSQPRSVSGQHRRLAGSSLEASQRKGGSNSQAHFKKTHKHMSSS